MINKLEEKGTEPVQSILCLTTFWVSYAFKTGFWVVGF